MCTYNITINDNLIHRARPVFKNDQALSEWMQMLINDLLHEIVKKHDMPEALEFPVLPADFKISDEILNLGTKFPEGYDFEGVIDEMHESYAK